VLGEKWYKPGNHTIGMVPMLGKAEDKEYEIEEGYEEDIVDLAHGPLNLRLSSYSQRRCVSHETKGKDKGYIPFAHASWAQIV